MSVAEQVKAYQEELVNLGRDREDIVVCDPDYNKMNVPFAQEFPDRYYQFGVAEANAVCFAAGLALTGKTPFVNAFSMFIVGRVFDQIRQSIALQHLNVKLIGSHAGFSNASDGATHQCLEDLALIRVLPNMTVLTPADAAEMVRAVRWASEYEGPVYIRMYRGKMPDVTPADAPLEPYVIRKGKDVALIAHGSMVSRCLEAADMLEKHGVDARIINMTKLKPVDDNVIVRICEGCETIVTAEEHDCIGGMSQQVAWAMRGGNAQIEAVAVNDLFGQSARDYEQLMEHYGLTAQKIYETVMKKSNI